ncbi:MAG: phosphotriesterase-related protein [Dehalococcoidia bacterium]|nr:phosphotriesterase-related protein [Dehalococcoidia bacterium]
MATVETVLGPVEGAQLGFTLSHEHVLISMGNDARNYPWRFDWEATRANAIRELSEAKAGGVDSMIDLSTPDLGRDVTFMRDVSQASGVNLIAATGIWRDVPRSFWLRDIDDSADIFVHEIEVGIEDTDIKAGVIKVANDAGGVTPEAERVLRAAARACKRTGSPISTHHWAPEQVGRRQVELFALEGTPMDRVAIGHCGDSTDVGYLESMLRAGVYLSMDRYPGGPGRPTWEQRNETVKALIERGWVDRLMLGHDHAPMPVVKGQVGYTPSTPTRYLHLSTVALPGLRAIGVGEEQIHTMMVEVPRRFLTGRA